MQLPSFLTGQLWKIATGGAAVVALVLSALLLSSYFTNRDLTSQRNQLALSINDPKTGYVAQLAQAHTNVDQLKSEITVQNTAFQALSTRSAAQLATAQAKLDAAQAQTRTMQTKLAGFMATKPQGATLEDRIRDIDDRAMQEFVQ